MALVPARPRELAPYNRWLTRAEQRLFDADETEQELHARHYGRRQRNLGQHARLVVDELTGLSADIGRKVAANDSPRLEDALEAVFADAKDLSRGILREAYGNG